MKNGWENGILLHAFSPIPSNATTSEMKKLAWKNSFISKVEPSNSEYLMRDLQSHQHMIPKINESLLIWFLLVGFTPLNDINILAKHSSSLEVPYKTRLKSIAL